MPTFSCSWEEFKNICKEFHDNIDSMNKEELENAWECVGLHYLGMHETMWQTSAATLLVMEGRNYFKRIFELKKF